MRWLGSISDSVDMNLCKLWETVRDRSLACCRPSQRVGHDLVTERDSLVAQTVKKKKTLYFQVKCLPEMWETWVQSLGQEDRLEKQMATHSRILAWEIPWTEETGGLQSMRSLRVGQD